MFYLCLHWLYRYHSTSGPAVKTFPVAGEERGAGAGAPVCSTDADDLPGVLPQPVLQLPGQDHHPPPGFETSGNTVVQSTEDI